LRDAFVRELRRFTGLGATFFRAAAGRVGMTAADVQVIDILEVMGPTTAGWLAEFTGLTTGAMTQMLDRLETAGLVRRERDPADGRRVIVRLVEDTDAARAIRPIIASLGKGWREEASRYDSAQLAVLAEFVTRANDLSSAEIARLRGAPVDGRGEYSAPVEGVESGRLVFASGASRVTLGADTGMTTLYRARFEGSVPEMKAEGGTVTVRYPRRPHLVWRNRAAEMTLNAAVPWQIEIRGGASEINADLRGLDLSGLEIRGGASMVRVTLPEPTGPVPVRIAGGASDVTVRRPAGVPARVHLKGWATHLTFDDQIADATIGSDVRLQSPGYDDASRRYDIEVAGSASSISLTAG
jgi:DNA-binding MarR family transcriptional regulator